MQKRRIVNFPKMSIVNRRVVLENGRVPTKRDFPWRVTTKDGKIKNERAHMLRLYALSQLLKKGRRDVFATGQVIAEQGVIRNPRNIFAILNDLKRRTRGMGIKLPKTVQRTVKDMQIRRAVEALLRHDRLLTATQITAFINTSGGLIGRQIKKQTVIKIMGEIRKRGSIRIPKVSAKIWSPGKKGLPKQMPVWLDKWLMQTEKGNNMTNYFLLKEYYKKLWLTKHGGRFFYWNESAAEKVIHAISDAKIGKMFELAERFSDFAVERLPRTLNGRIIAGMETEAGELEGKLEVIQNIFGFLKASNKIVLSDFAIIDLSKKLGVSAGKARVVAMILRWRKNAEIGEGTQGLARRIALENERRTAMRKEGKRIFLIDLVVAKELLKRFDEMKAIEHAGQLHENVAD